MKRSSGRFKNRERKVFKRRRLSKRRKRNGFHYSSSVVLKNVIKGVISTPKDFRFIDNPLQCLMFFNQIRNLNNYSTIGGQFIMRISFANTLEIDFATISILKNIMEEFKVHGINFKGDLPKDEKCGRYLIDSGFLNNMFDSKSQEIQIPGRGKYFSLEKKKGRVSLMDLESFDTISSDAFKHIMGVKGHSDETITLLKEIGGNAVEWSNALNSQWQIGVFQRRNSVVFTVCDLGRGIRDSLYISRKLQAIDFFTVRNDLDIIERAFERKYGSLSQEVNRNRGLPSIKKAFRDNRIRKLIVCTNNVFINFDNTSKSILLNRPNVNFSGTFYQWELNKTCFN